MTSFTLRLLYSWETSLQHLFSRTLGGTHSRSERIREKKTLLYLAGIEPRFCGSWDRSLIPIQTTHSHWNSLTFTSKRCSNVPCIFTCSWDIPQVNYAAVIVKTCNNRHERSFTFRAWWWVRLRRVKIRATMYISLLFFSFFFGLPIPLCSYNIVPNFHAGKQTTYLVARYSIFNELFIVS